MPKSCTRQKNRKEIPGSITVFLTLLLVIFFSAVFAFLEAARVCGLQTTAKMYTRQAADGWMSNYKTELWKRYRILGFEGQASDFPQISNAEALQKKIIDGNTWKSIGKNYDFYALSLETVTTQQYELMSDRNGAAFYRQATEAAKEMLGKDAWKKLKELPEFSKTDEQKAKKDTNEVWKLLEQLEHPNKQNVSEQKNSSNKRNISEQKNSSNKQTLSDQILPSDSQNTSNIKEPSQVKTTGENPLQWMKRIKKDGILGLVMPGEKVSQKTMELSSCVSRRTLQSGTFIPETNSLPTDALLFRMYLQKYFSNAGHIRTDQQESALDYEMEYLIAGKNSDRKNLKAVVQRLLLLREGVNLAFLETHPEKKQKASITAAAITTAFGQPELAAVAEHAILAVWAYAESISDVRILLEGGKVLPVKTEEQWHTDLDQLSAAVSGSKGNKQQKGLDYTSYLQVLLGMIPERKIKLRSMDLIEKNIGVQMDTLVTAMDSAYIYHGSALFWNLVKLGNHPFNGYTFTESFPSGYLVKIS